MKKLLKNENFWRLIANILVIAIIIVLFICIDNKPFTLSNFIDIKTYVAIVLAIILNSSIQAIVHHIVAKDEDRDKLIEDYDRLNKIYHDTDGMIEFINNSISDYKRGRKGTNCTRKNAVGINDRYEFPVAIVANLSKKALIIDDKKREYVLPEEARANLKNLKMIHGTSKLYNSPVIRADDFYEENESFTLVTGRSQYFYSLATNRAMDYGINGISLRDCLEFGPKISRLADSELSNHLGFNGFVQTSDGKYLFVQRHKHVSIGKNMLQVSVGASLKAKHALDANGTLSIDGIIKAMTEEICDEFNLRYLPNFEHRKEEIFKDFGKDNICYFYRDLVEGGKPQFMFDYKIGLTSDELVRAFTHGLKRVKRTHDAFGRYFSIDGYKLILVDKDDMSSIYIAPDIVVIGGQEYKIMPSHSACLALLRKHIDNISAEELKCVSKYDVSVKENAAELCEDAVYIGKKLAAVIDGTTSKATSKRRKSGGVLASEVLQAGLKEYDLNNNNPYDTEMLEQLNKKMKRLYKRNIPSSKASVIIFNYESGNIISYGDCGYKINGAPAFFFKKKIDEENAGIRSAEIERRIEELTAEGVERDIAEQKIISKLQKDDFGRERIKTALIENEKLANSDFPDGYPALDGGILNKALIKTVNAGNAISIVLASDGYPQLFDTLAQSERELKRLLKTDPLCFRENKGTKGMYENNISYDDRSYLRFTVNRS